jgi:hypothetical protein
MLAINLMFDALSARICKTSPVSRINLPNKRFAESFAGIGKSFTISVVTAIPVVDVLLCERETI